jgi:hypothetical protein
MPLSARVAVKIEAATLNHLSSLITITGNRRFVAVSCSTKVLI